MPSPLDALQNAQMLRQSPSRANMANYDDIFAGPAEGHVPSAWEQQSGDENANRAETALGAGPAIDALRHAMDEQRMQGSADLQSGLDDQQTIENDFNANGLNRGLAHANVQGQVGDVLSEAKARREFLPWGQAASEQNDAQAQAIADARYGQPARIKAYGDVQAAQAGAQGRIGAAQAAHGNPMEALYKAFDEWAAIKSKKGEIATPDDFAHFKQTYGIQ